LRPYSFMIHAYYHQPEYQEQVLHELPEAEILNPELVLTKNAALAAPLFAQDIWPNCEIITIKSINDAIKQLKAKKLRWYHYPLRAIGRGKLIAKELAGPELAPYKFPVIYNNRFNFGIFSLLNDNEILVCANPWKRVPLGIYEFVEDKINPPNRAYLKLWEALSFLNQYPQQGEHCIDLGAAPGGWTWVLAQLGAKVLAVDKAELAPHIKKLPQVKALQESAFALTPQNADWLVCDVICYPERSLALIEKWLATAKIKHFICTIKLQGEENWGLLNTLKNIPKAKLIHLYQNKHELTWFYQA
jgi:23S rRNA (cytidine2498-2'-O)-methyltransferase